MYEIDKMDIDDNPNIIKDFAFILNLENIHVNFSHNKEEILNIKNSPILFFDRNLNISYVYHYDKVNYGQEGKLIDEFICGEYLLDLMKNTKYEMGEFLDIKYFIGYDFKELINGIKNILQIIEQKKKDEDIFLQESHQESSKVNVDLLIKKLSIEKKENFKEKENKLTEDNSSKYIKRNSEEGDSKDITKSEEIKLSKHNTYIISANTLDDLIKKVDEMKNKKFIVSEDAIERNTNNCNY